MGTFNVLMRVGDLAKTSFAEVEALADTGSIHSYIPRDVLESINVQPTETRSFAFADERIVEMPFGYATFVIGEMEVIAPVIFADEGTGPILGATTLEAAHLATDSVNERLTPVLPMGRFGNGSQGARL
jgi:clan AA aspartic protease